MSTTATEKAEKAQAAARELRSEKSELERANRRLKGFSSRAADEIEKLRDKKDRVVARLNERDSVERTLLVSVVSNAAAGGLTFAVNSGIRWGASKSPWLAQRVGYAQGLPHAVLGLVGAGAEVATRPSGVVSTAREITYRTCETFAVIGAVRVADAFMEARARQAAAVRAALAAQRPAAQS